jgi:membrane protease YdiL (CAAX protease family)
MFTNLLGIGASSQPGEAPAEAFGSLNVSLIAVGLIVLAVWIVRRVANPGKLSLTGTPPRRNSLNPAHVALVLIVFLGATAAAGAMVKYLPGESLSDDKAAVLISPVAHLAALVCSLLVASVTFRFGARAGMGLSSRHAIYDAGRALVAFLAVWPVCMGVLLLSQRVLPPDQGAHPMLIVVKSASAFWQAMVVLSAVVMAPLAEEIFFRGLLQSMLRRHTRRPWISVLIASALFAAVHFPIAQAVPALFVLGIVLGYNYERSGRLYAPIIIHAVFNAVNILLHVQP